MFFIGKSKHPKSCFPNSPSGSNHENTRNEFLKFIRKACFVRSLSLRPLFIIYHPPFKIHHPPFTIHHASSTNNHLFTTIQHSLSTICHYKPRCNNWDPGWVTFWTKLNTQPKNKKLSKMSNRLKICIFGEVTLPRNSFQFTTIK